MKILIKIIGILVVSSIIITGQQNISLAFSIDQAIENADSAIYSDINMSKENRLPEEGDASAIGVNTAALQEESRNIFSTLFTVGVVVTVIIGAILGIKFISASVEGKAQIKEMFIPYAIGCVVIFGAYTIWSVVVNSLARV